MIILLFIFLPLIFIYLLRKARKTTKSTLPPGPPALPFIGNLHQLATAGDLHLYFNKLAKKYGPIIHLKLGSIRLIVVSNEKLAKEVLKTQDLAFCSRPKSFGMKRLSYENSDVIFSPYNAYWREMRKIMSLHLLNPIKTLSFRPIREEEINRMIDKISKSATSHEAVNMSEVATALSSSLICRIAFGKRYEEHGSDMRRFEQFLKRFFEISLAFFVSDYFPAFGWVDKLVGSTDKVDIAFESLDSFYQELLDEHLDPRTAKTKGVEDNILDILLDLKESSSFDLTWDNIKALLMNIFVAGAETSSTAIIWTLTALIKAPHIMKKLQAEIRDSIGEKGTVEESDLPNLPYLKAVVSESLRLYPPGPLLVPRETMERCSLDGYEIQPKTMVYVNAWAVARDPAYWENPEEFVPERFLNSNIDVKGQDFGLIPFGSGRRICPGMFMGLTNVELAIANLVYSFDWELPLGIRPEDVDTTPSRGLAVQKKIPLLLVPKKYIA